VPDCVTVFYEPAAGLHVGNIGHECIPACWSSVVVLKILHDANITKMALVAQPGDEPVKK